MTGRPWFSAVGAVFLLFTLAACSGGPAAVCAPPLASAAAVSLAEWQPVAPGLDRVDVGDGIVCFRLMSAVGTAVALECPRVLPMQWQIEPGPKIARRPNPKPSSSTSVEERAPEERVGSLSRTPQGERGPVAVEDGRRAALASGGPR